jgi:hypothetical protein
LLGSIPGALALGAVRGVEIAYVLRNRLREQHVRDEREPPSLGRAPIAPYIRRFLPAALAPFATTLVLSVPWLFALDAACASIGGTSGGTLATAAAGSLPALAGVALLGLGLAVLARELTPHEHVGETPGARVVLALKRRAGSSMPPPDPDAPLPDSFPPPSHTGAGIWDSDPPPSEDAFEDVPPSGSRDASAAQPEADEADPTARPSDPGESNERNDQDDRNDPSRNEP